MQTQKEKFNHTLSILVDAFMKGTLEHGNCSACAVGNLVAAAMGTCPKKLASFQDGDFYTFANGTRTEWQKVFLTPTPTQRQRRWPQNYSGNARHQIDLTGYTWEELALIELAFEKGNTQGRIEIEDTPDKEQAMFNGLMAVVDVLCEIHGMNETEKQESKALFVKV